MKALFFAVLLSSISFAAEIVYEGSPPKDGREYTEYWRIVDGVSEYRPTRKIEPAHTGMSWDQVMAEIGKKYPDVLIDASHFLILFKDEIQSQQAKAKPGTKVQPDELMGLADQVQARIKGEQQNAIVKLVTTPAYAKPKTTSKNFDDADEDAAKQHEINGQRQIDELKAEIAKQAEINRQMIAAQAAQAEAERIRREKTDSYNRDFQMRQIAEDAARDAQRRKEWDDTVEAHRQRIKN